MIGVLDWESPSSALGKIFNFLTSYQLPVQCSCSSAAATKTTHFSHFTTIWKSKSCYGKERIVVWMKMYKSKLKRFVDINKQKWCVKVRRVEWRYGTKGGFPVDIACCDTTDVCQSSNWPLGDKFVLEFFLFATLRRFTASHHNLGQTPGWQ